MTSRVPDRRQKPAAKRFRPQISKPRRPMELGLSEIELRKNFNLEKFAEDWRNGVGKRPTA